jgi:hypothetical protein
MESYSTDHPSYSTATLADLRYEGLRVPRSIELNIAIATDVRYCIEANGVAHIDSDVAIPEEGPCKP